MMEVWVGKGVGIMGIMDGMVILSIITWVSNRYGEDRRNEWRYA